MLRILEISWLALAIIGAGLGLFKFITEGFSESLFILIFTILATFLYLYRRKQRIYMEKENRNTNDASVKS